MLIMTEVKMLMCDKDYKKLTPQKSESQTKQEIHLSRRSSVLVILLPGDPSLLAGFDEPRLGPALQEVCGCKDSFKETFGNLD